MNFKKKVTVKSSEDKPSKDTKGGKVKKPEMGDTSDDGDWSWTDSNQDWEGTMESTELKSPELPSNETEPLKFRPVREL